MCVCVCGGGGGVEGLEGGRRWGGHQEGTDSVFLTHSSGAV